MAFTSLELNPAFPAFNRSQILDPSFRSGPSHQELFKLVYQARAGSPSAAMELADVLYWTLREETFEAFQKIHGPLPIRYHDWFYSKLVQFLETLVYEGLSTSGLAPDGTSAEPKTDQPWDEGFTVLGSRGPWIEDADIEMAFTPADNTPETWVSLIRPVSAAQDRLRRLLQIVALRLGNRSAKATTAPSEPKTVTPTNKREWVKNEDRNRIICNLLARGEERRIVCEALDARTIGTLPIMKQHNVHSWVEAWESPELRPAVQRLFSKQLSSRKAVKS